MRAFPSCRSAWPIRSVRCLVLGLWLTSLPATVLPVRAGVADAAMRSLPAAASETVAIGATNAHTSTLPADAVQSPLQRLWAVPFPGPVSYPLVADGRIYVIKYPSPGQRWER